MKPTMSMALNKEHLDELLFDYYKNRSELLDELLSSSMTIQKYRSGGFLNTEPDMTRIGFDMPLIKASPLIDKLKRM